MIFLKESVIHAGSSPPDPGRDFTRTESYYLVNVAFPVATPSTVSIRVRYQR